jgi:RNA polymerase sigma factor (sigma-70 family)
LRRRGLDLDALPSSEPSCEETLSMREEVERLVAAIKALTDEAALLFIYVKVDGLKLAEAAEKLDLSPEEASRLLYRTKQFLRSRLAPESDRHPVPRDIECP